MTEPWQKMKEHFTPKQEEKQHEEVSSGRLDVGRYLDHYGIQYKVKVNGGSTLYCLQECIFDKSHHGNESAIGQMADGKLFYQCFHNSCKGRTWKEARFLISGGESLPEFMTCGRPPRAPASPRLVDPNSDGVYIDNVYDAGRMLTEYERYIRQSEKARFLTGIEPIDHKIRGVSGGEVLTLIARAGTFKTAMLQNMLKGYIKNSSWAAAFFSLEMPVASVAERYHEIIEGYTGRDVEHHYLNRDEGSQQYLDSMKQEFIRELQRLYVIPVKVGIKEITEYVRLIERHYQTKVGVIGIDYLGLMDGNGKDEYEIVSKLARDVKTIAKRLDLPVILLAQTSRKAGTGDVEISLDMGRGSGAIEEGADFVLGLFHAEQPKLSTEDDEAQYDVICKILKNRKGPKNSMWKLDLDQTTLRLGSNAEPWVPPKRKNRDAL